MQRLFPRVFGVFLGLPLLWTSACSDNGNSDTTGSGGSSGSSTSASSSSGAETSSSSSGGTGGGGPQMFVEKKLDVSLALSGTTLTITVKDGNTPVMTDAWLYTLQAGKLTPLTGFQDPDSKRRYRGLMMPCKLAGTPSNLVPCDDGVLNGVMTDLVREKIVNGMRQSAIDGTVNVTLDAAPTDPVVVVVAREDQRYAGAAAIDANGKSTAVPAGVGDPEMHRVVTYDKDIAPLVTNNCSASCHNPKGIVPNVVLATYDNIVVEDFGHKEGVTNCQKMHPNDPAGEKTCEDAITHVEYLVEPGNPAVSGVMRRTVPDEQKSVSPTGLLWYGSKGSRFGNDGDRRMPPSNITADTSDDMPVPTYFDDNPDQYQLLWDWVTQGAPQK